MYHACSNLPSSRNISEIYAQATSGRVKQATLLVIILCLKCHDSPFNSMLKCIFLYVCVCVCVCVCAWVCACYTYGSSNVPYTQYKCFYL